MSSYKSKQEYMLYNEYVIADKKYQNQSTQIVTLVPTVSYEPKTITLKDNWSRFRLGDLVWITRAGTIKPVKYDMRKCDTMLVVGESTFDNNGVKQLRLMGKRFGLQTLDLFNDIEHTWQWKFYPTQLHDIVLVKPDANPDGYKIVRNFTMESKITKFFESQRQH
ncbi:MAG: hypothetical protein IJQ90_02625 [Alphaproteobacteria bacterium]|nr:hypothetical protein [Alphaproteobacteria bacterium]